MISKFQICYIMYVYIDNIISVLYIYILHILHISHIAYIARPQTNSLGLSWWQTRRVQRVFVILLCGPQHFTDCMFHLVLVRLKPSNTFMQNYANTTSTFRGWALHQKLQCEIIEPVPKLESQAIYNQPRSAPKLNVKIQLHVQFLAVTLADIWAALFQPEPRHW